MEEFATRFADFLESSAIKVRSVTVDRISRYLKITALGLIAGALVTIALIYLIVGLFRLLSVPLTATGAYAALGGLFVIAGAFVWVKRKQESKET